MKRVFLIDKDNDSACLGSGLSDRLFVNIFEGVQGAASAVDETAPDVIAVNADCAGIPAAETLCAIKSNDALKYIPVVAVTASNDCKLQAQLCSLGADDLIHLPLCSELIEKRLLSAAAAGACAEACMNERFLDIDELIDMVSEQKIGRGGFLVKEKDFTSICRFVRRGLERNCKSVQILIMTLTGFKDKAFVSESEIMKTLSKAVQICLRKGDISSVCSKNQIVIMLMDTDDDGGHLVANRIVNNFYGECDDDSFELHYDIRQLSRAV